MGPASAQRRPWTREESSCSHISGLSIGPRMWPVPDGIRASHALVTIVPSRIRFAKAVLVLLCLQRLPIVVSPEPRGQVAHWTIHQC
jgi:hypothetical protein